MKLRRLATSFLLFPVVACGSSDGTTAVRGGAGAAATIVGGSGIAGRPAAGGSAGVGGSPEGAGLGGQGGSAGQGAVFGGVGGNTHPSGPGGNTHASGSGGIADTAGSGGNTNAGGAAGNPVSGGGGGAPDAAGAAGNTNSSGAGGASPSGNAVLRVHYPAGSHELTLRGSGAGLSWTTGAPLVADGDVWQTTLTLTDAIEWKPLLDDATWSRGPNYRVSPGETLDIYPHFVNQKGRVETLLGTFHSMVLNNDRAIYAYLPASYDENTDATYPVVYMHDGQNLWAALPDLAFGATWNVDTTFDEATEAGSCSDGDLVGWGAAPLGAPAVTCTGDGDCASGACRTFPEAIVIGVANTSARIYEYTPTTDPTTPGGGGADLYLQMLVTELKPTIDGLLRTRPDVRSTTLSGSSLGGLVSAYAGLKYPQTFGQIAALSPSSWWNDEVLLADIGTTAPAPDRPAIVYIDSGAGSVDDETDTDNVAAEYVSLGYIEGQTFRHVVEPDAQHSEVYWAERFPGAMQLTLGVR